MHKRYLIPALIWSSLAFGTSATELSEYPQFCERAASNEEIFAHFKAYPIYQQTLQHVSYDLGNQCLAYIKREYPYLLEHFEKFKENDSIGRPEVNQFGEYGYFSPTNLRYIKVAGDLIKHFGDMSAMHVVEIGAGYGGQCKVLADLGMFASYTIIDLPQCNLLTKKVLDILNVKNVEFVDNHNLTDLRKFDLVISNYAFSEIDSIEQEDYLRYVLDHAPNGYMLYNFCTPFSMPYENLLSRLEENQRVVQTIPEEPKTNFGGRSNEMLIWKNKVVE